MNVLKRFLMIMYVGVLWVNVSIPAWANSPSEEKEEDAPKTPLVTPKKTSIVGEEYDDEQEGAVRLAALIFGGAGGAGTGYGVGEFMEWATGKSNPKLRIMLTLGGGVGGILLGHLYATLALAADKKEKGG